MRHDRLMAGAMMLGLAACSGGRDQPAPAKAPAGPRLTLAASDTVDWQDVGAEVATADQAQVIARIPGLLTSLSVKAGDTVRRGQVLGRVSDAALGYQARAAGAQAAAASADLARVRFLYQNGVYAKARLDQAEAQAGAMRAQHAAAGALAGQGALIAPAAGRVLRADVPQGAPVAPGTVVAVVTAGPVVLRLDLPESLAARVRAGAQVRAVGLGPAQSDGAVTKVYPAVSAGQVAADARMAGLDDRLIGRRVSARVEAGRRKALLVPASYVTSRFGIDYVTLLGRDGSAAEVPVQTASAAEPGKVELLSGVAAGETLIGPGR